MWSMVKRCELAIRMAGFQPNVVGDWLWKNRRGETVCFVGDRAWVACQDSRTGYRVEMEWIGGMWSFRQALADCREALSQMVNG